MSAEDTKRATPEAVDEMPSEYDLDHSQARPNRFAARLPRGHDASIVLDPDVARSAGAVTELDDVPAEWLAEFEAAARRSLPTRFRYAFIKTYKPVLDDEPFRAFDTTADYRRWCEENLPDWLGYGRV
jgi:hypothetical protein